MATDNLSLNRILAGKLMVEPEIYTTKNWNSVNKIVVSKIQGNLLYLHESAGPNYEEDKRH